MHSDTISPISRSLRLHRPAAPNYPPNLTMRRRRNPTSSSSSSSSSWSSSDNPSSDSRDRKRPSSSRRRRGKRESSPLLRKNNKKRKPLQTRKKLPYSASKKRRGRDASDSSSSSRSCSTCSSRSRSRSRSKPRRKLDERSRSRGRIKRTRRTSRMPSSCSSDSGRGRSRPCNFFGSKGEDRVEIIQEYGDDIPSSRSNDSLDIVDATKRDAAAQILRNVHPNEGDGGGGFPYNEAANTSASCMRTEGSCDGSNLFPRLKSMVIVPAEPAEADDLEALLRQKALENLRKYRRSNSLGHQSSLDDKARLQRDQLDTAKQSDTVQVEHEIALDSRPIVTETESTGRMETNLTVQDRSRPVEYRGSSVADRERTSVSLPKSREGKNMDQCGSLPPFNATPKNASLVSIQGPSTNYGDPMNNINQHTGQENSHQNLLTQMSGGNVENQENEIRKKNVGLPSAGPSAILDQGPRNKNIGEKCANEDSELESKTMTVMRGGELVQVKYKVYIPKKSPSSARRQLKR